MKPAEPLVSLVAPGSLEADQYRTARQAVERLRRESGFQVFAVTSPGAGDGKTITTLNIAGALAQAPQARVLVIDADLHRPSVSKYLGLDAPHTPGLAEVISDPACSLARAVRRLDAFNLSVLPAGDARVRPYEILASGGVEGLLAEARRSYDFVVIDTPPVVALGDSRLLGRWVDGFIVVVAAHKTPRKLLAEALTLLEPARIVGVVFNGDDRPLTAYYGYHGYYNSGSAART